MARIVVTEKILHELVPKLEQVLEQALRKTGQIGLKVRPGFSIKSKEAVPKTEVLEQSHMDRLLLWNGY
jgi:hypothetical protein